MLIHEVNRDMREMERDLRVTFLATGQYFTWRGVEIPCVPSMLRRGVLIDSQGNSVTIDLTLKVRRAHFIGWDSDVASLDASTPTLDSDMRLPRVGEWRCSNGQVLTWDSDTQTLDDTTVTFDAVGAPDSITALTFRGVEYRVLSVSQSPETAYVILDLVDPNSNR